MRCFIWFYRVLSITFGGIAINSNNRLYINKYLKYYGYFGTFLITITNLYAFQEIATSQTMTSNTVRSVLYCLSIITNALNLIHVSVNLWFLNRNGRKLLEIIYNFKIDPNRSQILLIIIWICHVLTPIIFILIHAYELLASADLHPLPYVIILGILRFLDFIAIWAVSILTWIISLLFYKHLNHIKHTLELKYDRNTGLLQKISLNTFNI